jgi:hypothetical protein
MVERPMETREAHLEALDETVSAFFQVYRVQVNPEILVYEGWRAKDILAHITFWHESFARNLCDLVNGVKPRPLKGSYSDLNQRCMAEFRPLGVEEIFVRLSEAQSVIRENILNPELVSIPYKVGSRAYSPEEHLEIVIDHVQKHMSDIKKAS